MWIDEVHVGSVRATKSEIFGVTDAPHTIRVSMDWCKSAPCEVDLSNGGTTELVVETIRFLDGLFLTFLHPSRVFSVIPKGNIESAPRGLTQ